MRRQKEFQKNKYFSKTTFFCVLIVTLNRYQQWAKNAITIYPFQANILFITLEKHQKTRYFPTISGGPLA